jgi:hypothetical protein
MLKQVAHAIRAFDLLTQKITQMDAARKAAHKTLIIKKACSRRNPKTSSTLMCASIYAFPFFAAATIDTLTHCADQWQAGREARR